MDSSTKLDSHKSNFKSCLTNTNTDETVSLHLSTHHEIDQEGTSEITKRENIKEINLRNKIPKELSHLPQWDYWFSQFEGKKTENSSDSKPSSGIVEDNSKILTLMKCTKSKSRGRIATKSNGSTSSNVQERSVSNPAPTNQTDNIVDLININTPSQRDYPSEAFIESKSKRRRITNFPPLRVNQTSHLNNLFRIPSAKSSNFDEILCSNGNRVNALQASGEIPPPIVSQKEAFVRPIVPKPEITYSRYPYEVFEQSHVMPYFPHRVLPRHQVSWASSTSLCPVFPMSLGNQSSCLEYPILGNPRYFSTPSMNYDLFLSSSVTNHPQHMSTPLERLIFEGTIPSNTNTENRMFSNALCPLDRIVPCLSQTKNHSFYLNTNQSKEAYLPETSAHSTMGKDGYAVKIEQEKSSLNDVVNLKNEFSMSRQVPNSCISTPRSYHHAEEFNRVDTTLRL